MRVLVCSDRIGALTSSEAGRALAAGWAGQATAVVPAGEAGDGFLAAVADRLGTELVTDVVDERLICSARTGGRAAVGVPGAGVGEGPIPYASSSLALGRALHRVLDGSPRTVFLDLVSDDVHDGGAGLLAGLGAVADVPLDQGVDGLSGLTTIDLSAVRERLVGVELVGVLPSAQRQRPLLGLRGITSVRGRANDEDAARLLAADADLERLTALTRPEHAVTAGAGGCGGTAFAVLALGGRLATGPELTLAGVGGPVDLVVTGCGAFDFASRGGGVVAAAAELAGRLLSPCVVVAGEVLVGGREMRTMGIEAAYAVSASTGGRPTGGDVSAAELTATAERVARSWRW